MHYRASQHSTTNVSPASLMLGREMELPLVRLRAQGVAVHRAQRAQAKRAVARRQREMKQHFDQAHRARKPHIQVSD